MLIQNKNRICSLCMKPKNTLNRKVPNPYQSWFLFKINKMDLPSPLKRVKAIQHILIWNQQQRNPLTLRGFDWKLFLFVAINRLTVWEWKNKSPFAKKGKNAQRTNQDSREKHSLIFYFIPLWTRSFFLKLFFQKIIPKQAN